MAIPALDDILMIGGAIVALQFLAAIIGPGALKFVSVLAILAAAGLAAYAFYLSQTTAYPGEAQDGIEHAIQFGVMAIGLLLSHLVIRGLFKSMARASVA